MKYLDLKYLSVAIYRKPYRRFGISVVPAYYTLHLLFLEIHISRGIKLADCPFPPDVEMPHCCVTDECNADIYCEMAIEDNDYSTYCFECYIFTAYEYLDDGGTINNIKLIIHKGANKK